ncbi:polyribonucleotide nucleotidyltransferase [Candidatus Gracilibacteria bacterium]|nr:polyribonucleotide nucleotidyltransferase [Candidatus Gracilibacteria bacterium]
MELQSVSLQIAGRELKIANGPMVSYATGYAVVSYGDTVIMANASMSDKAREGTDFFPMVVDYEENYFANGKIKGSRFVKREGRPSEEATLISRLIDRPLRPMFPKGTINEVQIIASVLSADGEVNPATTAIIASSVALLVSGAPMEGPVSAVRIGLKDGQFIINPTYEETDNGQMNLVVAGTLDAITMVEAGMNEVPEEKVLEALALAHEEIKKICQLQLDYVAKFQIEKIEATIAPVNEASLEAVKNFVTPEMLDRVQGVTKKEVKKQITAIEQALFEAHKPQIEEGLYKESELANHLNSALEKHMRKNILEKETRLDGRKLTDVRPLNIIPDVLPRAHGSAIFQRGETMTVTVATLGGPSDAQIVDSMDRDITKRYFHHYKFPPYSTGEIKMLRGPGRREIGHGDLAERALIPVIPTEEQFPYTIWVHSQITKCNGSSSMASVCGSTLSLMCAGVPIKAPVVGIAMGLVSDEATGQYKILTDIQGMEDFAGDMDFKVTGTKDGLTALQMDIKISGLSIELLRKALTQASEGRGVIMDAMLAAVPEARKQLSKYAPLIMTMQIDPEMIGKVIGKGGETIQEITKECGVEIDISDDGLIKITAPDGEKGDRAKAWVERITYVPKTGDIFDGTVIKTVEFGAFVEITPGTEGLVHISELANHRVNRVEDIVKQGDKIKVKILGVDDRGKIKLSHKALLGPEAPKPMAGASSHEMPSHPSHEMPHGEIVDGTHAVRRVNGE